METLEPNVVH